MSKKKKEEIKSPETTSVEAMEASDARPAAVVAPADAGRIAATLKDVPRAVVDRLRPMMEAAGVPLPEGLGDTVPDIYLGAQIRDIAIGMGDNLRGAGLYLLDKELVTINEGTGQMEIMTAERFVSWCEDWLHPWAYDKQHQRKYQSMSPQKAKLILLSDHFRAKLPRLLGVHMVKLPVWRRKTGRVELLPQGYDAESEIFTVRGGLDYLEDMDAEKAVVRWKGLHRYFPWGDEGRSLAVHTAAALSVFCGAMIPRGARVPMFFYNSNIPGSGKSMLVKMILLLVYGRAGTATLWEKNEDFKKELDSAAQQFEPFLFFDDVSGRIKNNLLNAWLTSARWDGRIMGTRSRFTVPLRAATFLTGNQVKLSEDLGRRTLIVDLFASQTSNERTLPADADEITDEWVSRDEIRMELLACLWAMVRNFHDPKGIKARWTAGKPVASFEAWSRLIPPIVQAASFSDPTQVAHLPDAGSNDDKDRVRVVVAAINEFLVGSKMSTATITLAQLAGVARTVGAFLDVLGTVEDVTRELDQKKSWPQYEAEEEVLGEFQQVIGTQKSRRPPKNDVERLEVAKTYMDKGAASSFGYRIRKALGMMFQVGGGRYMFGGRDSARQSSFVIRAL
ncbi:MAG: hypothetical protein KA004_19005 [Verrucomicrobiales bacterium]|nr:hypothetical protein [Verrucomicrobiales bacterium]